MRIPQIALSLSLSTLLLAAAPAAATEKSADKPRQVCSSAPATTGSRLAKRTCVTAARPKPDPVAQRPQATPAKPAPTAGG